MTRAERFTVVFLDFDGVLNSHQWAKEHGGLKSLDPRNIAVLNELLRRSGAKIVVSSTWRLQGLGEVRRVLSKAGCIGEVIGVTPILTSVRGREIQAWLTEHSELVSSFVILDDDSDMEHLRPRLVKTSFDEGLQLHHLDVALAKLQVPWATGLILGTA